MIALSVSDVTLSFGTDVILKDVSFSVNDGDRVGVIGVNGAGKTSLFKIINGIYTPDSGAVYVQKGHTLGTLEQNADLTALPPELTCLMFRVPSPIQQGASRLEAHAAVFRGETPKPAEARKTKATQRVRQAAENTFSSPFSFGFLFFFSVSFLSSMIFFSGTFLILKI